MYRVALNAAIDLARKESIQPRFTGLSKRETDIAEKAIILLYLDTYNYDEIASIIGITKGHVGVKINRIKKQLKK